MFLILSVSLLPFSRAAMIQENSNWRFGTGDVNESSSDMMALRGTRAPSTWGKEIEHLDG